jgi:uncharacterized membrane protein
MKNFITLFLLGWIVSTNYEFFEGQIFSVYEKVFKNFYGQYPDEIGYKVLSVFIAIAFVGLLFRNQER